VDIPGHPARRHKSRQQLLHQPVEGQLSQLIRKTHVQKKKLMHAYTCSLSENWWTEQNTLAAHPMSTLIITRKVVKRPKLRQANATPLARNGSRDVRRRSRDHLIRRMQFHIGGLQCISNRFRDTRPQHMLTSTCMNTPTNTTDRNTSRRR